MQEQCTTVTPTVVDLTLAAFMAKMAPRGRPKPKPLVSGAFVIVRLSKRKETMSSLTMQERHCRTYIERELGIPVLKVFQDIKSGLLRRAGYQEAMREARLRLCSHIVVYDFDRFSRERVSSLRDYADLEALGIEMHDTLAGFIDHESAGQKAVDAEKEARKTSRRVLDNMRERADNGDGYAMPRGAPWGYTKSAVSGAWEGHPEWGPVVQEMFRRADAGETLGSLQRWFNGRTGRRVRVDGITAMLANEYYAGVAVWNKTCKSKIHAKGGRWQKPQDEWCSRYHDHALVAMECFERVQARLAAQRGKGQQRAAPATFGLRGLTICRGCGRRAVGRHVKAGGYAYLKCNTCAKQLRYDRVERRVQDALAAVPLSMERVRAARPAADVVTQVEATAARIEAVRKRRVNLLLAREDAKVSGDATFTRAEWDASVAATDRELQELQELRDAAVRGQERRASDQAVLRWLATVEAWTDVLDLAPERAAARNEIYRMCLERIELDYEADAMTLVWAGPIAELVGEAATVVTGLRGQP